MSPLSSFRAALLAGLPLLAGCSATERTSEAAAPRAVPTEMVTDADRRALYNANGPRGGGAVRAAVPDATPNVLRLGEQASDINRLKRNGTLNTNDANITTTQTRMDRIDQSIPDTLSRP